MKRHQSRSGRKVRRPTLKKMKVSGGATYRVNTDRMESNPQRGRIASSEQEMRKEKIRRVCKWMDGCGEQGTRTRAKAD